MQNQILPKCIDVILPLGAFLYRLLCISSVFHSAFKFQDRRAGRENIRMPQDGARDRLTDKRVNESGDSSGYESGAQTNRSLWRKQESEEQ